MKHITIQDQLNGLKGAAFEVMNAIANSNKPLWIDEIQLATNMNRPAVRRGLNELHNLGYIRLSTVGWTIN